MEDEASSGAVGATLNDDDCFFCDGPYFIDSDEAVNEANRTEKGKKSDLRSKCKEQEGRIAELDKQNKDLNKTVRGLQRTIEQLEREVCVYVKRDQDSRRFAVPLEEFKGYRIGAKLKKFESGAQAASGFREPAVEYKETYVELTRDTIRTADGAESKVFLDVVNKILRYGCSALNGRCNMTLRMGVRDDRKVTGVLVENLDILQEINEAVRSRLEASREKLVKQANKKLKKLRSSGSDLGADGEETSAVDIDMNVNAMINAFRTCVGTILAVPVEGTEEEVRTGAKTTLAMRYVLEVDITPHAALCEDRVFKYVDDAGETQCWIRDADESVRSIHSKFLDADGKNFFEKVVQERAEVRKAADLENKCEQLQALVAELEGRASAMEIERLKSAIWSIEGARCQPKKRSLLTYAEAQAILEIDPSAVMASIVAAGNGNGSSDQPNKRSLMAIQGLLAMFALGIKVDNWHDIGKLTSMFMNQKIEKQLQLVLEGDVKTANQLFIDGFDRFRLQRFEYAHKKWEEAQLYATKALQVATSFGVTCVAARIRAYCTIFEYMYCPATKTFCRKEDLPEEYQDEIKKTMVQMHEFLKREREELKKVSYEERRLFLEVSNTALRFVDYDEPLVGDIGSPRKIDKPDLDLQLQISAETGNLDRMTAALSAGANIESRDNRKQTPLHLAAKNGHLQCLEFLLDNLANLEALDEYRQTPIFSAAGYGKVDCVRLLADHGCNVDAQNNNGHTAVSRAARYGHADAVRALVELGANLEIGDEDLWTPLHFACSNSCPKTVENLILGGADLNAEDDRGYTPLIRSTIGGSVDLIKLLLSFAAEIDTRNHKGQTALFGAANKGHPECVRFLLENGAFVDSRDQDEDTPLIQAAAGGYVDCMRHLIEFRADVNAADKDGTTPMLAAIRTKRYDALALLLENGASVNWKDDGGSSCLRIAAFDGDIPAAKLLLKHGADLDAKNNRGDTPLSGAAMNGHTQILKMLLDAGADANTLDSTNSTALHYAVCRGHGTCTQYLLEKQRHIDVQDEDGRTALFIAAATNHLNCVRMLMKHGQRPDVNLADKKGKTPIAIVAKQGHSKLLKLLVEEFGADPLLPDNEGKSPLSIAASENETGCLRVLLSCKADVNGRDTNGWTALHHAASKGNLGIIRRLMRRGAEAEIKDKEGKTAWDVADGEKARDAIAKGMINKHERNEKGKKEKDDDEDDDSSDDEGDVAEKLQTLKNKLGGLSSEELEALKQTFGQLLS